jgi:hypothetical protein
VAAYATNCREELVIKKVVYPFLVFVFRVVVLVGLVAVGLSALLGWPVGLALTALAVSYFVYVLRAICLRLIRLAEVLVTLSPGAHIFIVGKPCLHPAQL